MSFFHGIKVDVKSNVIQPSPEKASTVIGLVATHSGNKPKGFKTNEPFLVDSYSKQQDFGGPIGDYLEAIYAQIKCPVVVIGVEKDAELEKGIEKLKFSKQKTGLLPNVIISPWLSKETPDTEEKKPNDSSDAEEDAPDTEENNANDSSDAEEDAPDAGENNANDSSDAEEDAPDVGDNNANDSSDAEEDAPDVGDNNANDSSDAKLDAIAEALKTVAGKIGAIAIVDIPEDPVKEANPYNFSSERVVACWPPVLVGEKQKKQPLSPYLAGVIARNDFENGVHTSFSSKPINGIIGLSEDVDYNPFDEDCKANKLNGKKIVTVIPGPFKIWGNSGLYSEDKKHYKFISVVRMEDNLKNLLVRGLQWAVDRNITKNLIEEIEVYINNLLAKLKSQNAITGGKCWIDKENNSPSQLMEGKIFVTLQWTPVYVAESINLTQVLTNEYLKELFK